MIVNDRVVEEADWFEMIAMLDICELVTFPLIVSSTVAPISVVASTVVADGVGVVDKDGVGLTVDEGEGEDKGTQ